MAYARVRRLREIYFFLDLESGSMINSIHDKHGKSPIWSITSTSDFIGTNLLFSGGADSGVKMWQYMQTDSGCGNDITVCNNVQVIDIT